MSKSYFNYKVTGINIPSLCHERIKGIYEGIKYFVEYINLHNNGFKATAKLRFTGCTRAVRCTFYMEVNYILDSNEDGMDSKIDDFTTRTFNLVTKEYEEANKNLKIPSGPMPTVKMIKEFKCGILGDDK